MREIIDSNGLAIDFAEAEKALLKHPDITAAAVISVPSEQLGLAPVAFVEVWGPTCFNTESATSWVNESLDNQQRISAMCVLEHLPRSPSGDG